MQKKGELVEDLVGKLHYNIRIRSVSKKDSFCYLEADPLEADDSHEVFMMDEGETPPPDEEAMSNGTVVWA